MNESSAAPLTREPPDVDGRHPLLGLLAALTLLRDIAGCCAAVFAAAITLNVVGRLIAFGLHEDIDRKLPLVGLGQLVVVIAVLELLRRLLTVMVRG